MSDAMAMAGAAPPGPVRCGHCGEQVDLGGVGVSAVARCPGCARVLDVAPLLPSRPVRPVEPEPARPVTVLGAHRPGPLMLRQDAPFPLPARAEAFEAPGQVTLRYPDAIGRLSIAPLFGALGLVLALLLLAVTGSGAGSLWGGVAVLLVSGYLVAQAAVNRRIFRAGADGLHLTTGPLPWFRRRRHLKGVRALVVERNWVSVGRAGYRFIWELYARTESGEKVGVLEGLSDPMVANWLAQGLAPVLGAQVVPAADPGRADEGPP